MPVISPRRSSTTASGNIYGTSTSSSTSGGSGSTDSSSRISATDRSSSGYKSYLDRASSLSKLTTSSSSYSPSSYLSGTSSYSTYTPRSSYSTYRSSGSSLTGGSSGVGTYRSTFSSLGSTGGSSSYDTTSLSRYGVNRRSKASDTLRKNSLDKAVLKKPPSGSDYGGGSSSIRDSKRLSGSSSSSSLARLVATSGLDLLEKYSPAYYKPNTQLDSGSRSALNEAGTDLEERRNSMTNNDITSNITLDRPRTSRYSRIYSQNDTDETDNIGTSTSRRSTSGTRTSGRLSASNSLTNLQTSGSSEDIPTATFTLRSTRLRKSKVNDEEKKPLRNGTISDHESKNKYSDASGSSISNGIDTVNHVRFSKLKLSSDDKPEKDNHKSSSSTNLTKSGSGGILKTSSSREALATLDGGEVNCNNNSYSKYNGTNGLDDNETNKVIMVGSYNNATNV